MRGQGVRPDCGVTATPSSAQGARPAGISAKLVKGTGGLHGLPGTCHLVMLHGQVALYEELFVVRIKDRLLDVLADKALNRGPGFPEAQRNEFGAVTPGLPQQPCPRLPGTRR
jgi:hypothetical protein